MLIMRSVAVFQYEGQKYTVRYEWHHPYPLESADFMFNEGNYSCDCNRSIFIREQCDSEFPDLDCGESIELVSLDHEDRYGLPVA